jgi:hypothetical protein
MPATVPELADRRIGGPFPLRRRVEHVKRPCIHGAISLPVARGIGEDKVEILMPTLAAIGVALSEVLVKQFNNLLIAEISQPARDLLCVKFWFLHGVALDSFCHARDQKVSR